MRTHHLLLLVMTLALALVSPTLAGASTTTEIVRGETSAGENQPGWLFARDANNAVPYEFTTAQASTGGGSLYVLPLPGAERPAGKFIAEHVIYLPVSDLESYSWDFLIAGTGSTSPQNFYLNVYVNIDDSANFYDCRYDYVATTGSMSEFTTQEITPTTAHTTVAKRGDRFAGTCPTTLGGMPAGSTIRAINHNVGDTSASDANVAAYLDNVVLTTSAGTTTFDFEASPASKDDCKKNGFVSYSFSNQGRCVSYFNTNR
jgi:hypothetical protein